MIVHIIRAWDQIIESTCNRKTMIAVLTIISYRIEKEKTKQETKWLQELNAMYNVSYQ